MTIDFLTQLVVVEETCVIKIVVIEDVVQRWNKRNVLYLI